MAIEKDLRPEVTDRVQLVRMLRAEGVTGMLALLEPLGQRALPVEWASPELSEPLRARIAVQKQN